MNKIPFNITISSGEQLEIWPVPGYVVNSVMSKHKEPVMPKRKVNPEAAIPGITDDQLVDDPENSQYIAARLEWMKVRIDSFVDIKLVYGLRSLKVPNESVWPKTEDLELWEFLGLDVKVPESGIGRKLAYIKYSLLQSGQDMELVSEAIDSYNDSDKEEVKSLIDSFRNSG